MSRARRLLAPLVAVALLAACAPGETFFQPAGAELDEGGFGDAVRRNRLIQSGEIGYATDLNARFAASVPAMITFPFDSTRLTAEAQAVLARQADFIRQFPEVRFRVYGHADLVGDAGYNYRLGLRRAQAVVGFLAGQGVDPARLEALVSFGEERPLVPVAGREPRNRRAVTEVSGFVRAHPRVLDGEYAEIIQRDYVASATRDGGGSEVSIAAPGG
jgi:outer membrane protein OmpA-like peptidoglycan-associated protein